MRALGPSASVLRPSSLKTQRRTAALTAKCCSRPRGQTPTFLLPSSTLRRSIRSPQRMACFSLQSSPPLELSRESSPTSRCISRFTKWRTGPRVICLAPLAADELRGTTCETVWNANATGVLPSRTVRSNCYAGPRLSGCSLPRVQGRWMPVRQVAQSYRHRPRVAAA